MLSYNIAEYFITTFYFFIYISKQEFKNQTRQRIYILKVRPKYSAEYPTSAGPKIKPKKPIVNKFETVKPNGSFPAFTPSLKTIPKKFAVPKPNNITHKEIK